jgi:LPXTG-site transpeptidase (sortase) family protein
VSVPRWIERALLLIGVVCLGIWGYAFVDTYVYEYWQNQRLEEAIRQQSARQAAAPAPPRKSPPKKSDRTAAETDSFASFSREDEEWNEMAGEIDQDGDLTEGDLIGRIKIPRVGVSALVLHGVGSRTLRRGVGHIPGTAQPDMNGNVGLAGHRDSFFRGLKDISKNDTIELATLDGTFEYKVEWIKIVRPKDTQVLEDEGGAALTLVTCYPFYYVGSAPKRFIVRARRIGEAGEDAAAVAGPREPANEHVGAGGD